MSATMASAKSCGDCDTTNRTLAQYCKACGRTLPEEDSAAAESEWEGLVGSDAFKNAFDELVRLAEKAPKGLPKKLHMVIVGEPGTGKTSLADILARRLHRKKITTKETASLLRGEALWKSQDLAADFAKAKGGILFIDRAHAAAGSGPNEQLHLLLEQMDKPENKVDPIVVLAGLPDLRGYLADSAELRQRFQELPPLESLSPDLMLKMADIFFVTQGLRTLPETRARLKDRFRKLLREPGLMNGWAVKNEVEDVVGRHKGRTSKGGVSQILPEDIVGDTWEERTVDQVLGELDELVGMGQVRDFVSEMMNLARVKKQDAVLTGEPFSFDQHLVLTGNPGTGKTTLALILGRVFEAAEFLSRGHVVQASRTELVADHMGGTGPKVNEMCDRAMGGILFVDEAYELCHDEADTFGQQAVTALMKRMEDDRGKFVVIAAGYREPVNQFLRSNPGLRSRFGENNIFHIEDYDPAALVEIFVMMAKRKGLSVTEEALNLVSGYLKQCHQEGANGRNPEYANAREVRNFLDECEKARARRLSKGNLSDGGAELRAEDIPVSRSAGRDIDAVLSRFDTMVGMDEVREFVRELLQAREVARRDAERVGDMPNFRLEEHIILTGNPGTGKTTVARLLAQAFKDAGLLSRGHLVEVDKGKLVADHRGGTPRLVNQQCDNARGGVLFIDEAYSLADGASGGYGKEAVETLMKRMSDAPGSFVVIAAGYENEMRRFLELNDGIPGRFTKTLNLPDYSTERLLEMLRVKIINDGLETEPATFERARNELERRRRGARERQWGNAREVDNLFKEAKRRRATRLFRSGDADPRLLPEDFGALETSSQLDERLRLARSALGELVGLGGVQRSIDTLADRVVVEVRRAAQGLGSAPVAPHLLFLGNPGTGKTTVARLFGDILHALGILPEMRFKEVKAGDLLGEYVGHTERKTDDVVNGALGGVLFIDEAYALTNSTFGHDAINTLLVRMENDKGKLAVIAAGYPDEMDKFLAANPGLRRRFAPPIFFEDYTADERVEIFRRMASIEGWEMEAGLEDALLELSGEALLAETPNGNAGDVRKLLDEVKGRHAQRVMWLEKQGEDIGDKVNTITRADLDSRWQP